MINIAFEQVVKQLVGKVDSPKLEGRMVLAFILGKDSDEIGSGAFDLTEEQSEHLGKILQKRIDGAPLDKLLGEKDFYKYRFKVSEDVLSPRSDTEVLVEAAGRLIFQNKMEKVIDLGTGSGCILLSLLADFPSLSGVGIDASKKALAIAAENAKRLGVGNRCQLMNLSWFEDDFVQKTGVEYDMIVSNPPYIPSKDIDDLDVCVKSYDPLRALDGGDDGYDHYRKIAEVAPKILRKGGYILLEGGINQAQKIKNIFEKQGLVWCQTLKDLGGIERCIILKK